MAQEVKYILVNPGVMSDDNDLCYVCKVYDGYGGITIKEVNAVTGVAGTLDLILMKYGTSGTVAGATIAHTTNGTATVWAADTPQSLTITSSQAYCSEGEWLVLKKREAAAGNDLSTNASVVIAYVDGVVTDY